MLKTRKTKKIESQAKEIQRLNIELERYKSMFSDPLPTKHPDLRHKIELAFEVEGEVYYRFSSDTDLASYPRYQGAALYLELYPLKLTKDEFSNWLISLNEAFDKQDGSLARMLTNEMMNRQQHLTHIESIYQIAAQVFFRLDDDLGEVIDPTEASRRIKLFQKKSLQEFIALQPLDSIIMLPSLLDHFSQDASKVVKLMRMEQAIKAAQRKSWSKPKKVYKSLFGNTS